MSWMLSELGEAELHPRTHQAATYNDNNTGATAPCWNECLPI